MKIIMIETTKIKNSKVKKELVKTRNFPISLNGFNLLAKIKKDLSPNKVRTHQFTFNCLTSDEHIREISNTDYVEKDNHVCFENAATTLTNI